MKSNKINAMLTIFLVAIFMLSYSAFAQSKSLLFYKDSSGSLFRTCNLDTTELSNLDANFVNYPTTPPPNLVNSNSCTNLGSWYCDSDKNWKDALIYGANVPVDSTKDDSALKLDPSSGFDVSKETTQNICCPSSFCSNGSSTQCESSINYTENPKKPPIFKNYGETGYRCSTQGQWKQVSLKKDYNQQDDGYCTDDSQCYANNRCFNNGQWTIDNNIDHMCLDGSWTTRAKFIASSLVDYASRYNIVDYTLYCDVPEKALGLQSIATGSTFDELDYVVNETNTEATRFNDYILDTKGYCVDNGAQRCINNVCILTFNNLGKNEVIIGTSLNRPLNSTPHPLYEALGFTESDRQQATITTGNEINLVYASSDSGKLFYANSTNVMFYTTDDSASIPNFNSNIILYDLMNPFTSLTNFIKSIINGQPQDTPIIDKTADFDRLYLSHKGSKSIIGLQEKKYDNSATVQKLRTFVSINYTGFTSDICTAVKKSTSLPNSACDSSKPNSVYVFDSNTDENIYDSMWQDLTSKIRIN